MFQLATNLYRGGVNRNEGNTIMTDIFGNRPEHRRSQRIRRYRPLAPEHKSNMVSHHRDFWFMNDHLRLPRTFSPIFLRILRAIRIHWWGTRENKVLLWLLRKVKWNLEMEGVFSDFEKIREKMNRKYFHRRPPILICQTFFFSWVISKKIITGEIKNIMSG